MITVNIRERPRFSFHGFQSGVALPTEGKRSNNPQEILGRSLSEGREHPVRYGLNFVGGLRLLISKGRKSPGGQSRVAIVRERVGIDNLSIGMTFCLTCSPDRQWRDGGTMTATGAPSQFPIFDHLGFVVLFRWGPTPETSK